jgi:hypothetical protein
MKNWRLFLEDKFHEGGVEVVSDIFVLFLFGDEFVWKKSVKKRILTSVRKRISG